jgi:hypothetical protein
MAISRRLRFEILRRDDHTCRYCGAEAPDVKLTIDHVVAVALGGKDEPSNLVTACQPCNSGKSSTTADAPLVAQVTDDALRWAQARKEVVADWRSARRALTEDLEAFTDAWCAFTYADEEADGGQGPLPRDADWGTGIERWLDEGLLIEDLIELIPKAMHGRPTRTGDVIPMDERWRYFCGVVWRTLDDIQAATSAKVTKPADGDAPGQESGDQAYMDGFEDGRNYERSRIARGESGPLLCVECGERPILPGGLSLCGDCWGD